MKYVITQIYLFAIIAACAHVMVMSYRGYSRRTNTAREDIKYIFMGLTSALIGAIAIVAVLFV